MVNDMKEEQEQEQVNERFSFCKQLKLPLSASLAPPAVLMTDELLRENEDRSSFLGVVLGPSTPTDGTDGDRGNFVEPNFPGARVRAPYNLACISISYALKCSHTTNPLHFFVFLFLSRLVDLPKLQIRLYK